MKSRRDLSSVDIACSLPNCSEKLTYTWRALSGDAGEKPVLRGSCGKRRSRSRLPFEFRDHLGQEPYTGPLIPTRYGICWEFFPTTVESYLPFTLLSENPMKLRSSYIAIGSALALGAGAANAMLTLSGPEDFQGTGLGSVNTILTISSPGSTSTETGQVGLSGGAQFISGNALTGNSQTQTRSFADLSVTSAANLRVVFNALEPGNAADNGITLSALQLNVYNAAGTQTLFTANLDQSYTFANTLTGAGNSGFVFRLTDTEAAQLQTVFASSDRVGLAATANNATGGFETFFVANSTTPIAAIPEPETYALMLAGLGVLGGLARRRNKASQ